MAEEQRQEPFEPPSPEAIARIQEFNQQNTHAAEMRRLEEGGADYSGREEVQRLFRRCGRIT